MIFSIIEESGQNLDEACRNLGARGHALYYQWQSWLNWLLLLGLRTTSFWFLICSLFACFVEIDLFYNAKSKLYLRRLKPRFAFWLVAPQSTFTAAKHNSEYGISRFLRLGNSLVCMKLLKACVLGARAAVAWNWEPSQHLNVMLQGTFACDVYDEYIHSHVKWQCIADEVSRWMNSFLSGG